MRAAVLTQNEFPAPFEELGTNHQMERLVVLAYSLFTS
jgi:hypothetical protein